MQKYLTSKGSHIVRFHTPKVRILSLLSNEKITKNQPVIAGHAPCTRKPTLHLYNGQKNHAVLRASSFFRGLVFLARFHRIMHDCYSLKKKREKLMT